MQSKALDADRYLAELPADRRETIGRLIDLLRANLPSELHETMAYGMITYVVPKSVYTPGYHVPPHNPLPFVGLAAQKNHIALYHLGIYTVPELLNWFTAEYAKRVTGKLDMGKSCIRFRYGQNIPFDLIAELCRKMSVAQYVAMYEGNKPR